MSTKFRLHIVVAALSGVIAILGASNYLSGWGAGLAILPVACWMGYSYRRLALRKNGARPFEDMPDFHLRIIEALALAIETNDSTTRGHLRRVEVWAVEIGKELGLSASELKALRAAALLHDIGKLAVPELILSKPGRLSAIEYEKMKIHSVVGAEILERVDFPYPVAPIVRSHHEKWDGTGYPTGLGGERIPIGARILAAVDCLDALSSERPYRKAISLSEAVAHVKSQAGKSFDPRVVDALARSYVKLARVMPCEPVGAFDEARISEESAGSTGESGSAGFLSLITSARQEGQSLFALMHELGASLNLDETLSILAQRLEGVCPYDCIAIYIHRENKLMPEYVKGRNFHLFSSLEIPMGAGVSGWVAANTEPVVNGDPSLEIGYLNTADKLTTLNSALSAPLVGVDGVVGVLTLYHADKDAFTQDHLRLLLTLTSKVALSIENAVRYRRAETCAVTDELTGLPNARSMFLHIDSEIARCKRDNCPLTILVCDLDGFKLVNDKFGHLEGNKLLRAVGQSLRESCREYDFVARMGGDEFVVVLPGHPAEGARSKARLLSEIARKAGASLPCGEGILTMSVGEAIFPADGCDAEELLAEADRRMYQAKHERSWPSKTSELADSPKPVLQGLLAPTGFSRDRAAL